jgi:hypothetical protein
MAEAWPEAWSLSSTLAFALVERGLGFVVFLVGLEQWASRRGLDDDGVWSWPLLREHLMSARPSTLLAVVDVVFGGGGARALIAGKLLAGVALLVLPEPGLCAVVACWLTSVLLSVRFLGRENGAADAMINLVATAALGVELARLVDVDAVRAGVIFVAAQTTLSYLSAGVAKLRSSAWRSGRAPAAFVAVGRYRAPRWAVAVVTRPGVSAFASVGVLAWQLSFPLALWSPAWCVVALVAGASFHTLNAVVFGLHRFFWAWLITYPAVWAVSTWR